MPDYTLEYYKDKTGVSVGAASPPPTGNSGQVDGSLSSATNARNNARINGWKG